MAAPALPLEIEAKLLVPKAAGLRAIARLSGIGPYPLRSRRTVRLHSTYLDTPNLTLARHGVAFRLRRQGRQWEATVKLAGRVEGDLHERPELTVALPAAAPVLPFRPPPGPLYTQLAALAAGRPLVPILITEIRRQLFDVLPSEAAARPAPIAELALDRVRLRGPRDGQAQATYCEVEVEGRRGDRRDIANLAEVLRSGFDLLPSSESKFARGLVLIYGPGIVGNGATGVLESDTVQSGVRHLLARHLSRLRLHDPGTRMGDDPEALHGMRVATRRLRAAVRILGAGIPSRLRKGMSQELRWLGQLLGRVRDLDVQLAKLDRFATAEPAGFRPALSCLRQHLDGERARCRAEMLAGLDSARYFRLLLRLERFAHARERRRPRDAAAREPIVIAGRRAIGKAFRRLIKRGRKTRATPRPEDLHALRIRIKRLRYLLEFLQALTGKPGRRLVRRLTRLQDLLGSYHDAVVAADFVRACVEGPGRQLAPAQLVELKALVARELRLAERRRSKFETTWRRFARPRTADDCRAVLQKLRGLQAPAARKTTPDPAARRGASRPGEDRGSGRRPGPDRAERPGARRVARVR